MKFIEAQVGAPLTVAIESIFYLGNYNPEHPIERLVPDGRLSLVIELDNQERFVLDRESREPTISCQRAWFCGLHRHYISFTARENTELIGVRFRPGQALPIIHRDINSWSDRVVPAEKVFGNTVQSLRARVVAAPKPITKLAIVHEWLTDRWLPEHDPPDELVDAVEQISSLPTVATLERLHERVEVSEKRLVTLFKRHVGVTPKAFQRILRFSAIVDRLSGQEKVNWAELSVECGYYDQSHLVRDFSQFSGFQPSEFLNRRDDRENFFPESE